MNRVKAKNDVGLPGTNRRADVVRIEFGREPDGDVSRRRRVGDDGHDDEQAIVPVLCTTAVGYKWLFPRVTEISRAPVMTQPHLSNDGTSSEHEQ